MKTDKKIKKKISWRTSQDSIGTNVYMWDSSVYICSLFLHDACCQAHPPSTLIFPSISLFFLLPVFPCVSSPVCVCVCTRGCWRYGVAIGTWLSNSPDLHYSSVVVAYLPELFIHSLFYFRSGMLFRQHNFLHKMVNLQFQFGLSFTQQHRFGSLKTQTFETIFQNVICNWKRHPYHHHVNWQYAALNALLHFQPNSHTWGIYLQPKGRTFLFITKLLCKQGLRSWLVSNISTWVIFSDVSLHYTLNHVHSSRKHATELCPFHIWVSEITFHYSSSQNTSHKQNKSLKTLQLIIIPVPKKLLLTA